MVDKKMKVLNIVNNNGEFEFRIDGYIVADDDKWIYDLLGYPAVCPNDIQTVLTELDGKPLTVKINSYGGDVWSGSVIYTSLKDYKGNVTVKIDGLAASAASVIAMSGNKIMMSPTAQIMIHNASSGAYGDYNEMEKTAEFLKNVNNAIVNSYILKTGMSRNELLALMNSETWMTADDALEKGFIDEIMFSDEKIEPVVTNMLLQKAQNMYKCFNMPSKQAIEQMKQRLKDENTQTEPGKPKTEPDEKSKDIAKAMLEIEKLR